MKFISYLESLDDAQRVEMLANWQRCRGLLVNTGSQRQFAFNLEAECNLCEAAWEAIRNLISGTIPDVQTLQNELTTLFRNYLLQSSIIPPPIPRPLGKAITKERYIEILKHQFSFNSKFEEEQFFTDLLSRYATVDSNRIQLSGKILGWDGRIMWATFDLLPDGSISGRDPFVQMATDADGIRCQLGLDPNDEHKDILLFVYNLPYGITAYFPTIAEAYAGDIWHWYFRPAGEFENWGYTMTWPSCPLPPRPELIHEAITADNIIDKVRLVKGI